ncbi:MAG: nitroreductase family protein [Planctomycetes bacterium]|nr:nitroreductase family protein [Planctomycetota bacterium]
MDALEALRTRRSCRRFAARDVPRDLVEKVVDAGRLAATARNDQPWEFVVVTDPAARREIAGMTDYGPFIADAPVCIAVLCTGTKYYLEDGSAATQNILLAAHALGLGACWVAGDKKPYAPKIAGLLGAPEGARLVALVALGWPEGKLPTPPKRTLPEVLHWEKF